MHLRACIDVDATTGSRKTATIIHLSDAEMALWNHMYALIVTQQNTLELHFAIAGSTAFLKAVTMASVSPCLKSVISVSGGN
jgi:hypothetical protein